MIKLENKDIGVIVIIENDGEVRYDFEPLRSRNPIPDRRASELRISSLTESVKGFVEEFEHGPEDPRFEVALSDWMISESEGRYRIIEELAEPEQGGPIRVY